MAGKTSRRLASSASVILWVATTLPALLPGTTLADVQQARALQTQAVARIDHFVDYFRRTFDQKSLRQELVEATSELAQSAKLFQDAGARKEAAHSLVKQGDALRYLNEWDESMRVYRQGANLAREAQAPAVECKALLGNARSYLYGKKSSGPALELVRQALPLAKRSNEAGHLFDAWDMLAQVQVTEGDYVGAADSMNRAFAVKEAVGDDKQLYYGYLDRGDVYQHFAEKCDYERDFKPCLDAVGRARRDYTAAYDTAKRLGWEGLAQQTQGFISRLDLREQMIRSQQRMHGMMADNTIFSPQDASDVVLSGQYTAGTNPHLSLVFDWVESQGGMPPLNDARGAYIKGLISESGGERDEAMKWYLQAVDLLEEDRGTLHQESSRGAFINDKVEFYYTAVLNLLQRGREREAFELMERSRARVMSDLLATRKLSFSTTKERSLYAGLLELRGEIAQLQNCLFAVRSDKPVADSCRTLGGLEHKEDGTDRGIAVADGGSAPPPVDAVGLEALLKERQTSYDRLSERMARETPKLARLITSKPVDLRSLQKLLERDGSEVIAYATLESQVIIWHVSADSLYVRSVFLPRSTLKDKIARLRKSLIDPHQPYDDKTAHELYLYLISPVEEWIKSDHLVILAHEDLHHLPFAALQSRRGEGYLGERYQLSYAPSATVLASLQPAGRLGQPRLLAAADPSLRFAPAEVRAIGERFSGRVVDDSLPREDDIKAWVGGVGLIHLAVHGSFVSDEPLLSYLHLNAGDGDDGRLTAAEMYALPLDDAKLVVLSACETGSVHATHANEVIGMVRGLIFAGADSLLLSAWKIDDRATAEWMQAFYEASEDQPPAAAVQAAIKALRATVEYRHPYYWSPFTLTSR
jgi:CHAT domain-containing protein/tetratricopeptide (TPR) repeat protein